MAAPLSLRARSSIRCSMQQQAAPSAPLLRKATLFSAVGRLCMPLCSPQAHAAPQQQAAGAPVPSTPQELRAQIASGGVSCMAVFASMGSMGGGAGMADLYDLLAKGIDIYLLILTVRVLLTWFRNINWYSEPFRTLRTMTDPVLNMCRGIIPPISGIDLSPMLLFFGLNFAAKQLKILAMNA